jgi:hypothetical protein
MDRNWIPLTQTGPRVTDEDVRDFERTIGHELPPDYRAFLIDVNGGYAPSSHRVFRLRKDTTSLNSFYSLNVPDDPDDLASAQLYPPYPLNNLPKDGIAIGYDGTGSRIVLILAGPQRAEVWFLDTLNPDDNADVHGDWFRRSDVLRLAGSFREFVDNLGPRQADADAP